MTRARFALGVAAAVVAAFVVHVDALRAPFFADDWLFLDQVRSHSLPAVLGSPDPIGNFLRPLGRQVWFWTFARVGGKSPAVFHAANLGLFLVSIVLLARITRRVAGPLAGIVAASFLALHYAADVPVLWASGSQELVAVALALAALEAHALGRRFVAGVLLFLGLLSKEVVALTPLVAVMLDSGGGTLAARARRAWPLGLGLAAWLALALPFMLTRPTLGSGLAPSATGPLAVPVLLARVAFGLEWPTGALPISAPRDPGGAGWISLIVVLAGLVSAASAPRLAAVRAGTRSARESRGARGARSPRRAEPARAAAPAHEHAAEAHDGSKPDGVRAGLVWALVGALPVAAIAPVWSAYYFLFAMAGVGLALGSTVVRTRRPLAAALVALALLGWGSHQARALTEFATARSAWSAQGHVNRFYLLRGMSVVRRAVNDLRRQVPQVAPRTTFFFAGIPAFAAVQVGDGPLVRGVYRDSSLRGHYLSELSHEQLARGPWKMFFYDATGGTLVDRTNEPSVLVSAALGMILSGRPEGAAIALEAAQASATKDRGRDYVSALVAIDRGDTAAARIWFRQAEMNPVRGGLEQLRAADAALARVDSNDAARILRGATSAHALEPALHAKLADLFLARPETRADGVLEAYGARVLDPGDGLAWRRWAFVLARENRQAETLRALEHYTRLSPRESAADAKARELAVTMRRMMPGGDITQRALKRQLDR